MSAIIWFQIRTGKSNILARFKEVGIDVDPKDPRLDSLIAQVKDKEFRGWAFDSAEASFELMARRYLETVPDFLSWAAFG